jgi:hypothetical protein
MSLLSVVCCQVETSASDWSLVQRSPSECRVPGCDCIVPQGEVVTWNRVEAPHTQKKIMCGQDSAGSGGGPVVALGVTFH